MKKRNIVLAISLASATSLALLATLTNLNAKENVSPIYSDTAYSLKIDENVTEVGSDYYTLKNSRGTTFEFKMSYFVKGENTLGTLSSGGEILNYTAFRDIQSISIDLSSGSLSYYNGWKQYESSEIEYSSSAYQVISTSGVTNIDVSSLRSAYFKFSTEELTLINSITIRYNCSSSTVVPNLRLRIAKPTVGGVSTKTINDDNYVWINTNILTPSDTNWQNYLMTRDTDGSWYVDFNNVQVSSGGYGFGLYVCDSNTSISWDYPADANPVGFGIGEGQSEYVVNDINFANQPHVVYTTYTLNLNIEITGSKPEGFGNIQFVYNYTNSTSTYTWNNYISYSFQNTYNYAKSDLDSTQPLYFKVYMWINASIYVCKDLSGSNFMITPSEEIDSIDATLTFDISTDATIVGELTVEGGETGDVSVTNKTLKVYETATIEPVFSGAVEDFTCSFEGENIRIDKHKYITAVKAGTVTIVTLTTTSGKTCTFKVSVPSSTYTANYDIDDCKGSQAISVEEGWFTSTHVDEISGMGSDFYNGIDVSSFKVLIENGAHFYNPSSVEEHLFYILKHYGVNWLRFKLWVDPTSVNGICYGGGDSDLNRTVYMIKEAKAIGLNVFLDFHYSDYYAHPGQQILPKSWNDCTSKAELCVRIKSYTSEVLNILKDNECLPDMVQLGNEISSGIYLQQYLGGDESLDNLYRPSYLTENTAYNYGTTNYSDYYDYIKAASEGVDAVDSSIKKVLHWAKGKTISAGIINNFFNYMPSSYYDYAAISLYPSYCFDTIEGAESILNGLNLAKPWFIAETSHPFSGDTRDTWAGSLTNFAINCTTTGLTNIKSTYPFNGAGQAHMIHDLTNLVVKYHGLGIFYWESAWVPCQNVGWAASGSRNSWGNQGFFSFDGKAIANIDLFKQMSPYIN